MLLGIYRGRVQTRSFFVDSCWSAGRPRPAVALTTPSIKPTLTHFTAIQDPTANRRCLYSQPSPSVEKHYVWNIGKHMEPFLPSQMDSARILHHATDWNRLAASASNPDYSRTAASDAHQVVSSRSSTWASASHACGAAEHFIELPRRTSARAANDS